MSFGLSLARRLCFGKKNLETSYDISFISTRTGARYASDKARGYRWNTGRKKVINQQPSQRPHCVSHCIDTFCVTISADSIFFFILNSRTTFSKLTSRHDVTNVIKATFLTLLSHEVTDVNAQRYFADITQRH